MNNTKDIENILEEIFRIVLKVEKNNLNEFKINQENWDSLNHLKIMILLEEKFNLKIDIETAETLTSVKKIKNFILSSK